MGYTTRVIKIGGVEPVMIGGTFPVLIQTMWKDRLSFSDLTGSAGDETLSRIKALSAMGCGLLRFAVPDKESAEVVGTLASMTAMPLVADIHFDYTLALRCLDFPIAKIRINPGNIGSRKKIEQVLAKAASQGVPIRIGVNGGSLPQDLRRAVAEGHLDRSAALVQAAERELEFFQDFDFSQVLVSMKASSVADTIKANRLLAKRTDVPLHIGVTEAGPLIPGVIRNTLALHALLGEGIGDTIRVSLSDTMEKEVIAGKEILRNLEEGIGKKRRGGVTMISCPRCGRNSFDTHAFTKRWQHRLYTIDQDLTIAVMGCAVNGPEEARHADLGITGLGNKVFLFRQGKVVRTIGAEAADAAFEEELEGLSRGRESEKK
ncbi:MAG: flavodoxin-dependent (E)-4-hydroxy-3-methylbut-2-enyl-diphosphate synthase [Treponema sp.]|jgi:(E)-4-hydroxy-3-methylbut-2-enyl-diphosphate synthase|nr:flavodoxin-dependent (E)-4-hydroxy-3-methylbut-2-enyl-diphosphate synthase [Treponema sp.]